MKTKWMLRTVAGALFAVVSDHVVSNPTGGAFAPNGGSGSIVSDPGNPNTLIINQDTEKGVINWNSFGNQSNETIRFNQPGPSSITLNNVIGVDPSVIQGRLEANGNVWIVNPNGIQFGPTARVDVAGLLATTAIINKDDFMNGHYRFVQDPNQNNAVLVQQGAEIRVQDTGMVALVAPGVSNRGLIVANLGKVYLGSGLEYTVDLYGDNLIHFAVANGNINQRPVTPEGEILNDAVHNGGHIIAHGGHVVLSTDNAKRVVENVVNMEGVIEADTAVIKGTAEQGEIVLRGGGEGKVIVTGKMSASGRKTNAKGGTVKVLGDEIIVGGRELKEKGVVQDKDWKEIKEKDELHNTVIDVSGNAAKATDIAGGKIFIGGNKQGKLDKDKSFRNSNSTEIGLGAKLIADADKLGSAGEVIVWSDGEAKFYGQISVQGGLKGGDAGFIETSGKGGRGFRGGIDLGYKVEGLTIASQRMNFNAIPGYTRGKWLLDPIDVSIQNIASPGQNGTFTDTGSEELWTPSGSPSIVAVSDIETFVDGGTQVEISTTAAGGDLGNITLVDPINVSSLNSPVLILTADPNTGNIFINNTITDTNFGLFLLCTAGGSITLSADIVNVDGVQLQGNGVFLNGNITTSNGFFIDAQSQPLSLTGPFSYTAVQNPFPFMSLFGTGVTIGPSPTFGNSINFLIGGGTGPVVLQQNLLNQASLVISGNGYTGQNLSVTQYNQFDPNHGISINSGTQALSLGGFSYTSTTPVGPISFTGTGITVDPGTTITLSDALTFNAGAGNLLLNSSLTNSASSLTVNAADTIVNGNITINIPNQTYNSPIDGPGSLTLINGANPFPLSFNIGANIPMSSFSISASDIILGNALNIITNGASGQIYNSPIDGAQTLTLNAGANPITFNSSIGGTNALSSLVVTASDILLGSNLSINTTGDQTYNSPIDGAVNLTLNAGSIGSFIFNSNVGGTTPLSSITVANANNFTVNNGSVITTGAFTQQAGLGTTAFGNSLVSSTPVTIVTGVLTGSITAPAPLTLTANSCNITGTIGGLTAETISGKFPVFLTNNATAAKGLYFFNGSDIIFSPTPIPHPPFHPVTMNQAIRGLISLTASTQGLRGLISEMNALTTGLGGGGGANQGSIIGFGSVAKEIQVGGIIMVE